MNDQSNAIVEISKAELALERASDIHEMLDLRDMASAYQVLADAQGFKEAAQKAKIFQLKAERKAGDWLDKNVTHTGGNPQYQDVTVLPDGISKTESSRWQLEASLPEERFNEYIDESLAKGWEISASGLQKLAKNHKRKEERERKEPEAIKSDQAIKVKFGDEWICGKHRVICGDAYQLIDSIKGDALITDPPYGINYKPNWNKWDGSKSDFTPIIGDDEEFNPIQFMNYKTVLMFGANYYSNKLPLGGWLCWDKRTKEELDDMFGSPFELAWYRSIKTNRKSIMVRIQHGGVVNADSVNGNNEKRYHATQKPIALMAEITELLTYKNDIVIDPFAGGGSTLLACERIDRSCIAIEIDPYNTETIISRWVAETGEIPCRV